MLFSSATFLYLFLPAVLVVYYGLKWSRPLQNLFLLLASLFFYAWGEPRFVRVMALSIAVNWLFGLLADRFRHRPAPARAVTALDVVCNLAILFIFKYLGFTGRVLQLLGLDARFPQIALPIGVSFFTFQAMSYVLDVRRGRGRVQKNILNVGLYIAFFPQLIAGPIVRYETVAEEILHRKETWTDVLDGFARFVAGLSKKVLLANHFAVLADEAFSLNALSAGMGWLGAVAYAMQIFFDFSGYSDMAIGLGRMFGFHFLENFNYPYLSASVSDFWRRWHISLGSWFRDYVYIPLGGSRRGPARNALNLLAVWALTGLWHGANFTFLLWGLLHFCAIGAERLLHLDKKERRSVLGWLVTSVFILVGWVLFRADSVSQAFVYLKAMAGANGWIDGTFLGWLSQYARPLVIALACCTPLPGRALDRAPGLLRAAILCALLLLSVASLVGSVYNPFIYFNF